MINQIAYDIIKIFNVNKFIETGIKEGDTVNIVTSWFSGLYKTQFITEKTKHGDGFKTEYNIYEIDIDANAIENANRIKQKVPNIIPIHGDSVESLKDLIDNKAFTENDSCFFYLDAHTCGVSEPLVMELEQLSRLDFPFIVSIDDWSVPPLHQFGYSDMYCIETIKHCQIFKRTNVLYQTRIPNVHSKQSCYIFSDYNYKQLRPILKGLDLIETLV